MRLEELALIGNCQYAALVHAGGGVVWCCMPRFDGEPVFGALLDETRGGAFVVGPADGSQGVLRYVENTNVVETTFRGADGSFRVIDFAPRFIQHERSFRPTQIFRVVEPIEGAPRIRVVCDPVLGWSQSRPRRQVGSHHVSYLGFDADVRLTTDVPLSYLDGRPFALTERRHLVFTWGAPVEEPLAPLCHRFREQTVRYWRQWVKHCALPPWWQREVIRSALALKLHCFEDTGAIVAAVTTSLPESPGSGRTWDYRYCWLRDAYYALGAFRLLGHFEEREGFLRYLLDVASAAPALDLLPLYRIDGSSDLEERQLAGWTGYCGEGPVRVGNAAATHRQNDIYGEMVLALSPLFHDHRFAGERSEAVERLVIGLAEKAIAVSGIPDAGIWEYRNEWEPQSFSSLMCWAAADRAARLAERRDPDKAAVLSEAASRIRQELIANAWSEEIGAFVGSHGGREIDAAMLQAVSLRFLGPGDSRLHGTVDVVKRELGLRGWLRRYRADDGLGTPSVAFVICTFWLVEALARLGRTEEARSLMRHACDDAVGEIGLLSEDWDPIERRMWGNFPQAYSHVGLIHAAFAASPDWSEVD